VLANWFNTCAKPEPPKRSGTASDRISSRRRSSCSCGVQGNGARPARQSRNESRHGRLRTLLTASDQRLQSTWSLSEELMPQLGGHRPMLPPRVEQACISLGTAAAIQVADKGECRNASYARAARLSRLQPRHTASGHQYSHAYAHPTCPTGVYVEGACWLRRSHALPGANLVGGHQP